MFVVKDRNGLSNHAHYLLGSLHTGFGPSCTFYNLHYQNKTSFVVNHYTAELLVLTKWVFSCYFLYPRGALLIPYHALDTDSYIALADRVRVKSRAKRSHYVSVILLPHASRVLQVVSMTFYGFILGKSQAMSALQAVAHIGFLFVHMRLKSIFFMTV